MAGKAPLSSSWLWTLPLTVVLSIFAAAWRAPFKIEGDGAYSMKMAQQFVDGEVRQLNTLRLADPADLSRDSYSYVYWWPPGVSATLALLLKSGLNPGESGRLLMFCSAVIGALGWTLLIRAFDLSPAALPILATSVGFYVLGSGMAREFVSADPIVFALAPWLLRTFHKIRCNGDDSSRRRLRATILVQI